MAYLPEFINLMKDIRDNFFQKVQVWKNEIDLMHKDIKGIHDSFSNLGVDATHNVTPDAQNNPGDARVTYDPIHEKFTFWVPEGPRGLDGAQGIQGIMGLQGIQGLEGVQGPAGSQGIEGPTGPRGAAGMHGAQGIPGVSGPKGDKGDVGAAGFDGATGKQGPHGPQGAIGPIGPEGPHGVRGERGLGLHFENAYNTFADLQAANPTPEIGETHLVLYQADGQTPKGDLYVWDSPIPPHNVAQAGWHDIGHIQGPQGVTGKTGTQGPMGPGIKIMGTDTAAHIKTKTGTDGEMWIDSANGHGWVHENGTWADVGPIKGPKGDVGATGPRGHNGNPGVKGPRGESVKILGSAAKAVILAKSGADGDIWIATEDGHGYIHNGTKWTDVGPIRGPAGPHGVPGQQGIQGVRGPAGTIGHTGPQGPHGPAGPTGPRGLQGTQGPKGDTGKQGPQGIPGSQANAPDFATVVETKAGTATNKVISSAAAKAVYIQTATADGKYETKTHATSERAKLETKTHASSTYETKTGAAATYLAKTAIADYLSKTKASQLYETKTNATAAHALAMPKTGGIFTGDIDVKQAKKLSLGEKAYLSYDHGLFISHKDYANGFIKLVDTGDIAISPKHGQIARVGTHEIATINMLTSYMPKSGGTFTGGITAQSFKIAGSGAIKSAGGITMEGTTAANARIKVADSGEIQLVPKSGKKAKVGSNIIVTGSLSGTTLTLNI